MSYQYDELVCMSGRMPDLGMLFDCVHFANGCNSLIPVSEMEEHVENCHFRVISCPYPDGSCLWQGPIDHIYKHLLTFHPKIGTCHGEHQLMLLAGIHHPGPLNWFVIQTCFGQNFAVVMGKQYRDNAEQYYGFVQLIGSSSMCQNFTYRMELNANGRVLAWEGTTRSIFDGMRAVIESCDCFLFDVHTTHFFADSMNLQIHVSISGVAPQVQYQANYNQYAIPQPQPSPQRQKAGYYSNYEIPVIQID